jgi:hypothetical protein
VRSRGISAAYTWVAQFIAVCSASTLAEALYISITVFEPIGPNPTSLLPGAISLAETVLRPFQ